MKKNELKSLVKSARKTARKDIKLSLITELKKVTGKLGEGSQKLNKEIEKGAKQLAKKLAKKIKIDKSAVLKTGTEQNNESTPEAKISPRTTAPSVSGSALKTNAPAKPATSKAKPQKEV